VPTLRGDALEGHLERTLASLYVIHGDEPLLSLEAQDAIRARARAAGCSEREVYTVERGFDWSALAHAAAGMSLFADRKLIELRIPGGKPGTDGAAAITAYCAHLVEENVTLVTLPRLAWADQQSGWFKALSARAVVVDVFPVEAPRLPQWIAARLRRQGQSATPDALEFLADAVEGNMLAAHQEIQKLGLLQGKGQLDVEQVRGAVLDVSRHDVYQLAEAMIGGDRGRALRVIESLRGEGEAPAGIVWVLAEELRAVWLVASAVARGRSPNDALREARVFGPARQQGVTRAARRLDGERLERALRHAAHCERVVKGVARGDAWQEITLLAVGYLSQ
jgi:DNA polymerase-3 subunit delta